MLFNSFEFIAFLTVITILYWLTKQSYRWILLLIASYMFYMSWEPTYIALILISSSIDYFTCLYLTGSDDKKRKKIGLGVSVFLNLGLLFTFKYFNFFQEVLHDTLSLFSIQYAPHLSNFLLPVGISFYTFQTISYSIDVYRNELPAERHFGKFALYVSFFPQLIAGPIERAKGLLGQINKPQNKLKYIQLKEGVTLFLWGLFKKVVVADNAQIIADHFFNNSEFQNGGSLLFATFLFAIQIYADFSGYSDMAIGTAKVMGFELSTNFKTPYFSQSISEFWTRWHVTLSLWLRDYVYIPLGGSRFGKLKHLRNLFITFFLAGIWHGASWNFVVWAIFHATLIIIEKLLKVKKPSRNLFFKTARITLNFSIIIITMMIPVRTSNIPEMVSVYEKIAHLNWNDLYFAVAQYKYSGAMIGIIFLFITEVTIAKNDIIGILTKPRYIQYTWSITAIILILLLGDNNGDAFFYFQF